MRLIDADEAIALAKDIVVETKNGSIYRHRCIDPSCIEELPIVDAVPVVRCKDCKYYEGHYCWRQMKTYLVRVSDMEYCSRGERKEETEC